MAGPKVKAAVEAAVEVAAEAAATVAGVPATAGRGVVVVAAAKVAVREPAVIKLRRMVRVCCKSHTKETHLLI